MERIYTQEEVIALCRSAYAAGHYYKDADIAFHEFSSISYEEYINTPSIDTWVNINIITNPLNTPIDEE